MPTVAVLCVIGSFALRNNFFDVYVMLFFGLRPPDFRQVSEFDMAESLRQFRNRAANLTHRGGNLTNLRVDGGAIKTVNF